MSGDHLGATLQGSVDPGRRYVRVCPFSSQYARSYGDVAHNEVQPRHVRRSTVICPCHRGCRRCPSTPCRQPPRRERSRVPPPSERDRGGVTELGAGDRSEERRVGKECRCRWATEQSKQEAGIKRVRRVTQRTI